MGRKKLSAVSPKRKLHLKKYGKEDMEDRDEFLFGERVLSPRRTEFVPSEQRIAFSRERSFSRGKTEERSRPFDVAQELQLIKERNRRVEMDKAWETSWERRGVITVIMYILAGFWLVIISDTNPWLKALVPAVGYFLSTVTIFFMKSWWTRSRSRRDGFQTQTKQVGQRSDNEPPIV